MTTVVHDPLCDHFFVISLFNFVPICFQSSFPLNADRYLSNEQIQKSTPSHFHFQYITYFSYEKHAYVVYFFRVESCIRSGS